MVGALFYKSLMFIKRSFKETAWIGFAYVWFFGLLLVKPYWTLAPLVGFQSLELFLYSGAVLTISMQFYSLIVRDDIRSGVLQRVCLERRPLLSYLMGAAALPAIAGHDGACIWHLAGRRLLCGRRLRGLRADAE